MLSALLQGLISMHRAKRFTNDAQFRVLYRAALKDSLSSLALKGNGK
jgi:hypothetical protein